MCHYFFRVLHLYYKSIGKNLHNGIKTWKVVSSILGHSDTGFTYNTYIHLIEEQAQTAVGLLDEADE